MITKSDALIAIVIDDDGRLIGSVTDGDIRRAILENIPMDSPVAKIMNTSPKYLHGRGQRYTTGTSHSDNPEAVIPTG